MKKTIAICTLGLCLLLPLSGCTKKESTDTTQTMTSYQEAVERMKKDESYLCDFTQKVNYTTDDKTTSKDEFKSSDRMFYGASKPEFYHSNEFVEGLDIKNKDEWWYVDGTLYNQLAIGDTIERTKNPSMDIDQQIQDIKTESFFDFGKQDMKTYLQVDNDTLTLTYSNENKKLIAELLKQNIVMTTKLNPDTMKLDKLDMNVQIKMEKKQLDSIEVSAEFRLNDLYDVELELTYQYEYDEDQVKVSFPYKKEEADFIEA